MYGTIKPTQGGTGISEEEGITAGNFLVGNGTEKMLEKTPDEVLALIGALALSGGVMTGQGFYINNKSGRIVGNQNGFWIRTASSDVDNNADARHFKLWNATYQTDLTKAVALFDTTAGKDYLIYGEHNQPSATLVATETTPTKNNAICWLYE